MKSQHISRRRLCWLVVMIAALALYFPVNRVASGGVNLSLGIDDSIPLWAPAIIPYLLGVLLFIGVPKIFSTLNPRSKSLYPR